MCLEAFGTFRKGGYGVWIHLNVEEVDDVTTDRESIALSGDDVQCTVEDCWRGEDRFVLWSGFHPEKKKMNGRDKYGKAQNANLASEREAALAMTVFARFWMAVTTSSSVSVVGGSKRPALLSGTY